MKLRATIFIFLILVLLLAACRSEPEITSTPVPPTNTPALPTPTAVPSGETIRGQAVVDSIELQISQSFPVQVSVIARGELPDGCTQVDEVIQQLSGNTFRVAVGTIRPGDAVCTLAVVPFSQTIPLQVAGLDAGTYTVSVNGRTATFTLDIPNRLEPTPTPTPAADASISGIVWHDLCADPGPAAPADTPAPVGCLALPGGGFRANGTLEANEPGIAGVIVSLGAGSCPAVGLATTTTDANGNYTFANLPAGEYCVSVDALTDPNLSLLAPGSWTFPAVDVSSVTLVLGESGAIRNANFGWDYQFRPLPEVDPATCINNYAFVADLTVPDDTVFAPGTEFVKQWRLLNTGTCPWTTEYKLVTVDDPPVMGGQTEVALSEPIAPGQPLDISVILIAPTQAGTYRSNWQLANAAGERFGVGGFIEDAVYTRIIVDPNASASATPAPNSAVLGGVVWDDICFILSNGNPSAGCVERGENSGIFIANGTYDRNESPLPNIVVTLSRGACPADGVIPPADVLATATTNADGRYRFERLDAGTYCVSINAFDPANLNLLIPGDWSYPAPGVGRWGVVLQAGAERLNLDFGWDFR